MAGRQRIRSTNTDATLLAFACPNEDCPDFNRFGAGNLSVCERMGRDQQIRRLYCRTCGQRFSERQGTLLEYAKLPEETIVRIVKCLVHGCSLEATADICEVTRRTVESLLKKAGRRAEDFHRLQLEKLTRPLEVVELDELHGRSAPPQERGEPIKLSLLPSPVASDAARAARGFMRRWWARRGS
jgi:transposase-like protein